MARRRGKVKASPWVWLAVLAVLAAVFAAGAYVESWRREVGSAADSAVGAPPPESKVVSESSTGSAAPEPESSLEDPQRPDREKVDSALEPAQLPASRVAIVIDDLGRSLAELKAVGDLGIPVAYSVLPFETLTTEVVAELRRRDVEILCHLPMQPANGADPGPGALTLSMSRRQLGKATRRALDAVPGAVGVNNHMGSVLTTDPRAMETVLKVLAKRDLFFLDSRTTADTLGFKTARRMGVPAAERQVFLDGDMDAEAVAFEFDRLLEVARLNGTAIGIGHPYSVTLEVLAREIPAARDRGIEFVPLSYLLDRDHPLGP